MFLGSIFEISQDLVYIIKNALLPVFLERTSYLDIFVKPGIWVHNSWDYNIPASGFFVGQDISEIGQL